MSKTILSVNWMDLFKLVSSCSPHHLISHLWERLLYVQAQSLELQVRMTGLPTFQSGKSVLSVKKSKCSSFSKSKYSEYFYYYIVYSL